MRIGFGYDVHAFAPGRPLMLGCVRVPFDRGLAGHSDADVLAHALVDALLGAAGLGDIGQMFPDHDPAWAGAPGARLLNLTMSRVRAAGFELVNADLTVLAQRPKIGPHKDRMAHAVAEALGAAAGQVNIKAKTSEGLGFVGREEGLAAVAAVLLGPGGAAEI
jgi:2-C-methyl-D-erythritol 2,4-cyclodiphosphate synthase